ncbi:8-oxo-dGTP diphosphatase [Arthrobacter sp. CAN_C5]|uniref:8-oxo-dGTP diphosphatase n=1 Tax=Arthrobacter sp. CAN_C5 TaxID=2760706 RepID=UPI001AE97476|nr:NUDIX domain-containing protein [Arthrobacter sp. CAN_C5]MBP2217455.1 8-oxo-dGTP diphosphatase [Arthrobacter sp. CAN_C5]
MKPRHVALCFLFRTTEAGNEVLLGLKKSGFGAGRIVTLGGGVEPGETAAQAAVREVAEESGVVVDVVNLTQLGRVRWRFPSQPAADMDAEIFTAVEWSGTPEPTVEVEPAWYPVNDLPWEGMWEDAQHWLGSVIDGTPLDVLVTLNQDNETVSSAVFA